MNRLIPCTAALLLVILCGCASDGSSRYAREHKFVIDQAYVNAVNHASRQNGVRVTWVNPPTRRVPVDEGIDR
ncbi:MAG TPA: hypothetical protein PKC03_01440 [Dokdonella sp.]|jgi:hypothetical protein|nr:hypothetical protein [Dokdonella sp.]